MSQIIHGPPKFGAPGNCPICPPPPLKPALGTLQGNTLAPHLFIVLLDYELRKAINGHEE